MKRNIRVASLVLCGFLLAVDDRNIVCGSDRASGILSSIRRRCRPKPTCCRPRRCYNFLQTIPVEPARPAMEERDLGTFHSHDAPKRWNIHLPANVSKVEVAFYSKGQDYVTLNASFAGVLQLNGHHVIGFRGSRGGGYVFHNYLEEKEYFVHRKQLPTKGQFLDVTSLIKPGTSEFLYFHYTRTPVGLKVRVHIK